MKKIRILVLLLAFPALLSAQWDTRKTTADINNASGWADNGATVNLTTQTDTLMVGSNITHTGIPFRINYPGFFTGSYRLVGYITSTIAGDAGIRLQYGTSTGSTNALDIVAGGSVGYINHDSLIDLKINSAIIARVGSGNFQFFQEIKYAAGNESTGAGSALLGANSPASTLTAPFTWWKVFTSDGSVGYIPVWK